MDSNFFNVQKYLEIKISLQVQQQSTCYFGFTGRPGRENALQKNCIQFSQLKS